MYGTRGISVLTLESTNDAVMIRPANIADSLFNSELSVSLCVGRSAYHSCYFYRILRSPVNDPRRYQNRRFPR